jgi:signal transduction histidine kinase
VINTLQDASFGIGKDGKVLFANEQALSILGLPAAEIIDKKADEVAGRNDLFRYIVREENAAPFKIVLNGRESYFIKEKNDITIQQDVVGKVFTIRNITSFREKDVAKTNFLATISHELKTPLASTDIGLKLLEQERAGSLNPGQKEIVSDLQKDNQRLLKLVSELLDLSQAETGNINLNITSVPVQTLLGMAMNAMKQAAAERGVQLSLLPGSDQTTIMADQEKAAWVVMNLLSNAVKFSPEGEKVSINVTETEKDVKISIADKGPGIPLEYHARIFERFFKVPGSQQFHKGTGLGLSISKEFMQAMGGSISLMSQPGSGSTFLLTFSK